MCIEFAKDALEELMQDVADAIDLGDNEALPVNEEFLPDPTATQEYVLDDVVSEVVLALSNYLFAQTPKFEIYLDSRFDGSGNRYGVALVVRVYNDAGDRFLRLLTDTQDGYTATRPGVDGLIEVAEQVVDDANRQLAELNNCYFENYLGKKKKN